MYLTRLGKSHQVDISVHGMTRLWLDYQGLFCGWTNRDLSMAGRLGTCSCLDDQGLVEGPMIRAYVRLEDQGIWLDEQGLMRGCTSRDLIVA